MVKVQIFFDSLKQYFINIDKEGEYVIKKQQDILQFDWLDDTLFDKWMVDIALDEQFEEVETDSDEVQDDEIQIIDTTTQGQQEEENKGDQSVLVAGPQLQDVDTTEVGGRVKVTLLVQDEDGEKPRVEINLQSSEKTSSLASLAVAYTEESEQRPIKKSIAREDVTEGGPTKRIF